MRTGIEALAAVLGGTNSLHTNALDETLALPSEQAAEIALRTQQVIMEETGVVNVADPLGGSLVRRGAHRQDRGRGQRDLRQDPRDGRLRRSATTRPRRSPSPPRNGEDPVTQGLLRGIEDGWFMSEIAEAAFAYQIALEKGEKKVVGVNVHKDSVTSDAGDPAGLPRGRDRAGARPRPSARPVATRPQIARAIEEMLTAAREDTNMIPAMLDACRAEATLGEICDALREEWGEYREPARF